MKILTIVPKYNFIKKAFITKKNYNYIFPIGIGYIISVLKRVNYDVDCINLNHINGNIKEIITEKLNNKKYDFVCIGDMCDGYSLTEKVLNAVREHPTSPKTILGGLIITTEPEVIFESLMPDFGVIGEGEETIIKLLDAIIHKKDLTNIKGIIYKENNKTIFNGNSENSCDIDSLPFPDLESMGFEEYLDNLHPNFYGNHKLSVLDYPRPYPIMGSRSCPFHCTFCGHISSYKERTIKNIMKELEENIEKYKINLIFMHDDCFSIKIERVYEFCKEIKKLQEKVGWEIKWGTQMTVKGVTLELLKTMKEAGCYAVGFGFESYDKSILKSMRKPITPEEIDRVLKYSMEIGLMVTAGFIFGDIAETKETAKKTLDYWVSNCKGQVNLGFIQPFPGTEIYRHCLRKGIIKDKLEFLKNIELLTGFCINMTDNMTDKELKELEKTVLNLTAKHKKFIIPKKVTKTGKNIYSMEVICPYCKKDFEYKNMFIKNKLSYGFISICRHCGWDFYTTSSLQNFAYKHYYISRGIRDYMKRVKSFLGEMVA